MGTTPPDERNVGGNLVGCCANGVAVGCSYIKAAPGERCNVRNPIVVIDVPTIHMKASIEDPRTQQLKVKTLEIEEGTDMTWSPRKITGNKRPFETLLDVGDSLDEEEGG